ncbi:acyl-CoA dehydrogenase family protein [Ureibacillus sinduriensis]|uniref:Acyl-CoA dehydrogenase n=1 Tax=Ureibacillus sinduriensis BLB-1 = JCM 15800 TaxID=1384057 RepID=A0A0A3HYK8_9BACL|nr:acyl-CoA dehydrogenase family protein [Ureibacillus sinduriensis]KGR76315.1 acyl-CoA dehydrogenase [Ureibacillus sinduriensis BLB-1 = JCM 15800]
MSEMKDMIAGVVERIFKEKVEKETVDLLETGKWGEEVWQLLVENEIEKVAIKEGHGGAGGDYEDLFHLYRLVGKYAVPIPFVEHTLANLVLEYVNSQPQSGLSTIHIATQPLELIKGKVTGQLQHVPWARYAEKIVTLATEQGKNSLIIIDLEEATIENSTNLAAEPRDHLRFTDANILLNHLLTEQQHEFLTQLQTAATVSKMVGAIDRAFELTLQFSKEREQFGRPIHRFQLVQQHLAILAGEQALSSSALDNIIALLVEGQVKDEIAFARLKLDDASRIVATSAHQVHAAIGVTHEHRLHHYTRRLWAWRDEDFHGNYWRKQLADKLLHSTNTIWEDLTKS